MNEIEKLIKSKKTPIDYPTGNIAEVFELSKDDLKRLIELVENEQRNICSDAVSMEEAHRPYTSIRVSQKIDWEEL